MQPTPPTPPSGGDATGTGGAPFCGRLFDLTVASPSSPAAPACWAAELARGLARAGARVAVLGRRQAQAETVAGEIAAAGGEALPVPADVTDTAQLQHVRRRRCSIAGGAWTSWSTPPGATSRRRRWQTPPASSSSASTPSATCST